MNDRSHIVWPAAIISLLVASVIMMVAVLIAANQNGGVQVVDDYYKKAVAWDSLATIERQSNALNWRVEANMNNVGIDATGMLRITDEAGDSVSGMQGSVSLSRPQLADPVGRATLVPQQDAPGTYTFEFPNPSPGIWDLTVDATTDGHRLYHRLRIELRSL